MLEEMSIINFLFEIKCDMKIIEQDTQMFFKNVFITVREESSRKGNVWEGNFYKVKVVIKKNSDVAYMKEGIHDLQHSRIEFVLNEDEILICHKIMIQSIGDIYEENERIFSMTFLTQGIEKRKFYIRR